MTEHDQLKENAEKSRREQNYKELNAYMDTLHTNISVALKNTKISLALLTGTWIALIASNFVGGYVWMAAFVVYICAFCYMVYRDRQSAQAVSELKGALKILRILGLIDYDWDSLGSRRRRKSLKDLVDIVKSWAFKKKNVQEEMYQPA